MRTKIKGIHLAVLSAALFAVGCGRKEESKPSEPALLSVSAPTVVIGEQTGTNTYQASGTVSPEFRATLGSKIMGRITAVNVREGDTVRKGQVLIVIDSREYEAAMQTAGAGNRAAIAGVSTARTAAEMEAKTSDARILQADSQVQQAKAALAAAQARLDLALAGPRNQELNQARIAVTQAESSLKLAETELNRTRTLVEEGAKARRELEIAQNRFDLARGQYEAALQAENMAKEGTRSQEIRAAEEAVGQARGALRQAQAGASQARAAAMQVTLRRKEVDMARAQQAQSAAAIESARVNLSYTKVVAPFDGRVVQRLADPGTMAMPGTALIVVEGGRYRFEASVPERLLSKLAVGRTAPITIDSLGRKARSGTIVEIVPGSQPGSHSYTVKYTLAENPEFKSGMFGRVSVPTGESNRITIPRAAAWQKEGLSYVYVLNDEGIARLRFITLGEDLGENVVVLSGLVVGERVVTGSLDTVKDGVKVEGSK